MQTLLITDTHLSDTNVNEVVGVFGQVLGICKDRKIKSVIHCGDWFTSRSGQTETVLLTTKKIIKSFADEKITVRIIPGNHDKANTNSPDSFLDVFDSSKFLVVREYEILHSVKQCFLPYFKETGDTYTGNLKKIVEATEPGKYDLFTHIAINGVKNNDGSEVSSGIPENLFSHFRNVYVGHYHNQQHFDNIHYIGSPRPVNFGEDSDKGVWILDEYEGTSEFIPLQFPEYKTVKINVEDFGIEELDDLEKEREKGNFVRLVLRGSKTLLDSFDVRRVSELGIVLEKLSDSVEGKEVTSMSTFDKEGIVEEYISYSKEKEFDFQLGKKLINVQP